MYFGEQREALDRNGSPVLWGVLMASAAVMVFVSEELCRFMIDRDEVVPLATTLFNAGHFAGFEDVGEGDYVDRQSTFRTNFLEHLDGFLPSLSGV